MSRLDIKAPQVCVFLTCPQAGDHSHPVCDECGAVNYSSLTCLTCRAMRFTYDQAVAEGWRRYGERESKGGDMTLESVIAFKENERLRTEAFEAMREAIRTWACACPPGNPNLEHDDCKALRAALALAEKVSP